MFIIRVAAQKHPKCLVFSMTTQPPALRSWRNTPGRKEEGLHTEGIHTYALTSTLQSDETRRRGEETSYFCLFQAGGVWELKDIRRWEGPFFWDQVKLVFHCTDVLHREDLAGTFFPSSHEKNPTHTSPTKYKRPVLSHMSVST